MKRSLTMLIALLFAAGGAGILQAQEGGDQAALQESVKQLKEQVKAQQDMLSQLQKKLAEVESQMQQQKTASQAVEKKVTEVSDAQKKVVAPAGGNISSKYGLTLYGKVKVDAIYDTQKVNGGVGPNYVYPEGAGGEDADFFLTGKATTLGLDLAGPEAHNGKITGKIEVDFWGDDATDNNVELRMRLAYIDWAFERWSLRAGQDWDTFITVTPKTLNDLSFNNYGHLGGRRAQIRATRDFELGPVNLTAKFALTRNIEANFGDGNDNGAARGAPGVQWNLIAGTEALGTDKPVRFSVSGYSGQEDIADKFYDIWAVIGSVDFTFSHFVTLQGSLWEGANIDMLGGGIGQGVIARTNIKGKTYMTEIESRGYFAQLQMFPKDDLNLNLMFGMDNPADDDLVVGCRSKNVVYNGSLFYNITEDLVLGLEYSHFITEYLDNMGGVLTYTRNVSTRDNRVQTSLIFTY